MTPNDLSVVLFDVNHTLIGLKEEDRVQQFAVDRMYSLVRPLIHGEGATLTEFRDAYDGAWHSGRWASFAKYQETRYEDIVAEALSVLGVSLSTRDLEELLQSYMEPLYDAAYIVDGVDILLDELTDRVRLAAITNYKYASGMRGLLSRTGLDARLDAVVISSEVGWKKPSRAIYDAALDILQVSPGQCVLVGNELEKDLWQAAQLGMRTVLFTPDEHASHDAEFAALLRERLAEHSIKGDYVASTVTELRDALLSLLDGADRITDDTRKE